MMNWSHPSLDGPPPEFSVNCDSIGGRVLKGRTVIAWLVRHGDRIRIATPNARLIGWATSNADAMLMAIRDQESPR